jgi:hypothetical protein
MGLFKTAIECTFPFDTGNPFTVTAAPLTQNALALELSIGASLMLQAA